MQKFFSDTLESRYIKSVLYNSYIPTYSTVRVGDTIIKDILYVFNSSIIKCINTGTLTGTSSDLSLYKKIKDYRYLENNPKYTSNFISKYSYYDSETHKRLGDYLRFYRDQRDIDLMPLYNCYDNSFTSDFYFQNGQIVYGSNSSYKILKIPARFNKKYTIAIDSPSQISIAASLLRRGDFVFSGDTNVGEQLLNEKGVIIKASTSFLSPFTYEITNNSSTYQRYEKYLTILIQLPSSCDSSIAVLEGDYTDLCKKVISEEIVSSENYSGLNSYSNAEQDKLFISNLSLLRMNDKNSYAFSDKLILYLLNHAIKSDDEIGKDIERVQSNLGASYPGEIKDVWDKQLRKLLFDKYLTKNPDGLDILGYVDNDVEDFLLKEKVSR